MTDAKARMIEESRSPIEQRLRDGIDDREGPFKADIVDITLVEQYILETHNRPHLSQKEIYTVRHVFVDLSTALQQARYRVSLDGRKSGSKRYRCRAIRRAEHWALQDTTVIAHEYRRAWLFAQGHDAPATLTQATGDEQP